ncbi:MAG: DNA replication/repair protein RecF [Fimbriimonas ginsengisoli]|uniref:DNA replication and repair protein RecF n=1 Tax=Fimbriimonas ginsengisoli TaxID=1005039 RepID=A0A931LY04_FIMGI|nr:DNA replication/repair protein RecF [Fimbriimonas ginsengisoli]
MLSGVSTDRDGGNAATGRFGVSRCALEAFRNYEELKVEFSEGLNVLAGPNAQGKTNLLEALALVSTTRLLRGQRDSEAILEGRDRARVHVSLLDGPTELGMTIERGTRKRALLNGLELPRASDLLGRLPSVSVTSEDLEIVRGEPSERRLFLDLELSSLYPAYLRHLTLYKRALEQRNALLRAQSWSAAAAYEPWEEQLAAHGVAIRAQRGAFLARLDATARSAHDAIGRGEHLGLAYSPKDEASTAETFNEHLEQGREEDLHRGATSVGPHRDDVTIDIDERPARLFGSQGQQRTAAMALKLGCMEVARDDLGQPPMLLLDDMLSDLDELRRERLVELVLSLAGQVVLTCTEASSAGDRILSQARVFEVRAGKVLQVSA